MTPIERARMLTGESEMENRGTRMKYIRFNAKIDAQDGGIFQLPDGKDGDKKTYKVLGEKINGIILMVTSKLKTKLDAKKSYETDEFIKFSTPIKMYENQDFSEPVDAGNKDYLQSKYDLSLINVVYLYMNDQIYKLTVNGGSLDNLWGYLSSFHHTEKEETCLQFNTIIGREEGVNAKGLKYWKLTFTRDKFNDLWMNMLDSIEGISSRLTGGDTKALPASDDGVNRTEVTISKDSDNEVNIDDIPF